MNPRFPSATLTIILLAGCRSTPPPPPPPPLLAQAQQAAQTGSRLSEQQQWNAATLRWQTAAEKFALLNRAEDEANARHHLAHALAHLNQPSAALAQFEEAARLTVHQPQREPWWQNQIALLQWEAAWNLTNAWESRFASLLPQTAQIQGQPLETAFLNEKGLWHLRHQQFSQAATVFLQAATQFQDQNDPRGHATALANLAQAEEQQNQFDAALEHYRLALATFEQLASPHGIASCLAGQGRVLLAQDRNLDQAEACLRRAAANFETLNQKEAAAKTRQAWEQCRRRQAQNPPPH